MDHVEASVNTNINRDHDSFSNSLRKAGTGYMITLSETIRELQNKGYIENIVPNFDHFCCRSGAIKLFPPDFITEKMVRFENSSDPDDQAILYAIFCESKQVRGLYIDSYGLYHDELSMDMIKRLMECPRC